MPELAPPRSCKYPVVKKLAAVVPVLRVRYGIERIGIFGSFALKEQTRKSDVDVLVEFTAGYATLFKFYRSCGIS